MGEKEEEKKSVFILFPIENNERQRQRQRQPRERHRGKKTCTHKQVSNR